MGRVIDLDSPLSAEDKEYLRLRGRGHQIPANERRFGVNGDELKEGDVAGKPQSNQFYDAEERGQAVYDMGGAPLPNTVLDYNTGRVADRENGMLVEYTGPGHTNAATDTRHGFFDEHGVEGDIDVDIVDLVTNIRSVKELKKRIEDEGVKAPANAKREDLEDTLAIVLQDKRDGNFVPGETAENIDSGGGSHEAPENSETGGSE